MSTQSRLAANEEELRTKLLWRNRPRVSFRDDTFADSAARIHRAQSAGVQLPLGSPVEVHLETGTVGFREGDFGEIRGREITLGSSWRAAAKLSLEARGRYREMHLGETSQNTWLTARLRGEANELRLQFSHRDVDTLRAWRAGIKSNVLELQYSGRFGSSFRAQSYLSRRNYSDGNSRVDFQAGVTLGALRSRSIQIGGDVTFRDTDVPSNLYYTPESLLLGRVNLIYRSELASPWVVEARTGLGGGRDARRGARWITNAAVQVQRPFSRFKLQFDLSLARVPSYFSFRTGTFVYFRF